MEVLKTLPLKNQNLLIEIAANFPAAKGKGDPMRPRLVVIGTTVLIIPVALCRRVPKYALPPDFDVMEK